jgi:protein-S-isoprenylcysteine O-methyltransferase Ste14
MFKRIAVFSYGVISYVLFFGTFLYACGFIGNFFVPKTIDSGPEIPFGTALIVNAGLLGIFALQHSIMARRGFKNWLTRFIPKAAERSTFTLISALCLIALFTFWQPMGGTIWNVQDPVGQIVLYALFGFGWLLVLVSTFLINHFDLFGLRQVYLYLRNKEYTPLKFRTPVLYKLVRHPLYLGWLLAFWATPTMTAAHLVFAIATTGYILFAIQLEERDLIAEHGRRYEEYRQRVPMILPKFGTRKEVTPEVIG